jgi:CheY-like chemotaxis protein
VVDDEASIRSVTERTLTQHGYQVLVAANGKEALGLLASHPAAVKAVITDIMMPVMDGMALAHALKQSHPQMPVIACTGWGQEGIQAKLKGLGVESFLEKPYPSSALLTTLRQRLPAAR